MGGRTNKSDFQQAFIHMTDCKSTEHHRELSAERKKRLDAVKEQDGSCLTCHYITAQRGIFLHCSLKNKNVKQYNYCDKYISLNQKQEESKS